jgi:hypothetical protein
MWAPGKGYHQRYRTEALSEMFVGVGATVELYYTATADGDGYVTQDLTAAVGGGNVEERVLYYKAGAFGDSGTTVGYTNAGLATDATYAEMLTAFNNLLKTESAPITVYATRTEVSGRSGLLADYPGAAAAYSLRLLDTNYTGSAIRVRRASDNAEQDIGFDSNGDLDTTALATFCSGTDGFVKVWYCQSGNGNDAEQTTTGDQPKIYDSSTGVVTENGEPAVLFDGSNDILRTQNLDGGHDWFSIFSLYGKVDTTVRALYTYGLIAGGGGDTDLTFVANGFTSDSAQIQYSENSTTTRLITTITPSNYTTPAQYLTSVFNKSTAATSADQFSFVNGTAPSVSVGLDQTPLTTQYKAKPFNIGGQGIDDVRRFWKGTIQELILYPSDQSTNRTGIETNINDYYSIYTP